MLDKKTIDSSIIKDENTGLYKVTLPGINRYFESVLFSFQNTKKVSGSILEGIKIGNNSNVLIGISNIFGYKMLCLIDLENLKSNYFFLVSFDFFEFNIEGRNYFCLVYKDFNGKAGYYSDLDIENYKITILKNKLEIKNSVFGTIVFEFDIERILDYKKLGNKLKPIQQNSGYLNIADFFIFKDLFYQNSGYKDFINFLMLFVGKDISCFNKIELKEYNNSLFPICKLTLEIKDINNLDFYEFQKLLFGFCSENTLMYLIDNKDISKYFSGYLIDISKQEIGDFDINFDFSDNIFKSDEKFIDFKRDFLILKYNYFTLKESLINIDTIDNISEDNPYLKTLKLRGNITRENLGKTLISYEKMLNVLVSKLDKYLKQKKITN